MLTWTRSVDPEGSVCEEADEGPSHPPPPPPPRPSVSQQEKHFVPSQDILKSNQRNLITLPHSEDLMAAPVSPRKAAL